MRKNRNTAKTIFTGLLIAMLLGCSSEMSIDKPGLYIENGTLMKGNQPYYGISSTFKLSFGNAKLISKITEPFNPPEKGMENDRLERIESYIKEFKPLKIGTIHLKKGHGVLELKATEIPGAQVMDFRLLTLERI
jgi:hypothetical protein